MPCSATAECSASDTRVPRRLRAARCVSHAVAHAVWRAGRCCRSRCRGQGNKEGVLRAHLRLMQFLLSSKLGVSDACEPAVKATLTARVRADVGQGRAEVGQHSISGLLGHVRLCVACTAAARGSRAARAGERGQCGVERGRGQRVACARVDRAPWAARGAARAGRSPEHPFVTRGFATLLLPKPIVRPAREREREPRP